ncbi:MAG: hypothetical protein A2Z16_15470 [Chloroflexi bacterium RBG_16_54_18]|nr:MAG: hypothetical protein A2Z16_15470 [Chloroflexi bacterium RBG_16_54_18]
MYADSIQKAHQSCTLVSITPVEGAKWLSYDFVAEGFYPGERRAVLLMGELQIGAETMKVQSADLGLSATAEIADSEGQVSGNITFGEPCGQNVVLPEEFTFTVLGYYSGCKIEQAIPWPGQ